MLLGQMIVFILLLFYYQFFKITQRLWMQALYKNKVLLSIIIIIITIIIIVSMSTLCNGNEDITSSPVVSERCKEAYIGGRRACKDCDNWYWHLGDGTKVPMNYTNWNSGEPNNKFDGQSYIHMYRQDLNSRWDDVARQRVLPKICLICELY